jgi:hypothetical protein
MSLGARRRAGGDLRQAHLLARAYVCPARGEPGGHLCGQAARERDTSRPSTLTAPRREGAAKKLTHTARRRLRHPCELLRLFGDGGLDRSGNRRDQGYFAAELRPKLPPISSEKIFSAASIASTARSVAVFKDTPVTSIEAVVRANLGRDGSNLRSKRLGGPRPEYSGPSANRSIGRASGPGANRVHSRRAPAQ